MKFLNNERGFSLIEVVASILLLTVILIFFFSFFVQSKKTNILSESIVNATYTAQWEMEEIYGFVSNNNVNWLKGSMNTQLRLQDKYFIYDATDTDCIGTCKRFLSHDDPKHWIELQVNSDHQNLVNVVVNVPKKNSSTPVVMESIFRWGK